MISLNILPELTLREAMTRFNVTGKKCLIVVNETDVVIGTLSNGDIRKSILKGTQPTDSIEAVYNKQPICMSSNHSHDEVKKTLLQHDLDLIPIIDDNGKLIDYMNWDKLYPSKSMEKKLTAPVVIMAGGVGSRLLPFTSVLPKPLIPVHDKPIINHIIDQFCQYGVNKFWISVNFKSRILKSYFYEMQPSYKVDFINEDVPLGTIGSLSYLKNKIDQPFFVSNCDVIIKSDLALMYDYHVNTKADLTLIACQKKYVIPYGTCHVDSAGLLESMDEKPEFNFLVNTGLYIINPSIIGIIPAGQSYDITDLIRDMKLLGKKIAVYPIQEQAWVDIGQWADYKKAIEQMEAI